MDEKRLSVVPITVVKRAKDSIKQIEVDGVLYALQFNQKITIAKEKVVETILYFDSPIQDLIRFRFEQFKSMQSSISDPRVVKTNAQIESVNRKKELDTLMHHEPILSDFLTRQLMHQCVLIHGLYHSGLDQLIDGLRRYFSLQGHYGQTIVQLDSDHQLKPFKPLDHDAIYIFNGISSNKTTIKIIESLKKRSNNRIYWFIYGYDQSELSPICDALLTSHYPIKPMDFSKWFDQINKGALTTIFTDYLNHDAIRNPVVNATVFIDQIILHGFLKKHPWYHYDCFHALLETIVSNSAMFASYSTIVHQGSLRFWMRYRIKYWLNQCMRLDLISMVKTNRDQFMYFVNDLRLLKGFHHSSNDMIFIKTLVFLHIREFTKRKGGRMIDEDIFLVYMGKTIRYIGVYDNSQTDHIDSAFIARFIGHPTENCYYSLVLTHRYTGAKIPNVKLAYLPEWLAGTWL